MNEIKENPLYISWHDSTWIPLLNQNNVLDYFSERSNPLYDRTCNNEIIKMQKLTNQQLVNMTGLEYILLHVQEPILYVIRKQHRHSPTQVTPIADYYVLAGYVYQAPDLNAVISSRLSAAIHHLLSAFEEVHSFMRYHPTKGYSWEFGKESESKDREKSEKSKEKTKEEPSSAFQRARVDILLGELMKKFPPKVIQPQPVTNQVDIKPNAANAEETKANSEKSETKVEIKTEKVETISNASNVTNPSLNRTTVPPPEKRQRTA
ncbi:mediator of RNA polymerase II transcription subunit 6-like protein [Dinothrombium tinctorium]|uniref:Mediator of RNA polymerase II transcription subunit 6 n=1 Tax=Dinothrombium tinctorium TaxID=1965070 RepID=A0A3S3PER7_9ACAR|nr:mediator of RNA polymerase II transcription subunit 6-like protein [Dinothrombium tinctorium]RWS17941.1 mediator of RNA polymerase II transcription subunit 6-like protein [Dinothrombium tinctorium]